MQNDPELNPKELGKISSDFVKVSDTLREASYAIRKKGFSDFPIFPVCKIDQPIGQLLIEKDQYSNQWNYFASFLEEFVQRAVLTKENEFKSAYKDPDEYCCLFVIEEKFTNFVYIPYPID